MNRIKMFTFTFWIVLVDVSDSLNTGLSNGEL